MGPAGVQARVAKGKEIIYSCKHVFLQEQEAAYSLHLQQQGWRWRHSVSGYSRKQKGCASPHVLVLLCASRSLSRQ